jgi:exodeoxyribonuclease V alpha subunit
MKLKLQFNKVRSTTQNNPRWGILEFHSPGAPDELIRIKGTWPWGVKGINGPFPVQLDARRAGDTWELEKFHASVESLTIPTLTRRKLMSHTEAQAFFAQLGDASLNTLKQLTLGNQRVEASLVPSLLRRTTAKRVQTAKPADLPSLIFRVALVADHADLAACLADKDVDFMVDMFLSPHPVTDLDAYDPNAFLTSIRNDPVKLFWGAKREASAGLPVRRVRAIANDLNIPPSAPSRIHMEMMAEMCNGVSQGHMYTPADALCRHIAPLCDLRNNVASIKTQLDTCPLISTLQHPTSRATLVVLEKVQTMEDQVLAKLRKLNKPSTLVLDIPPGTFDKLHESQAQALRTMIRSNLAVISGAAGTGKTSLVARFVKVLQHNNVEFVGLAPTGKAALTLSKKTGEACCTIHRFAYSTDPAPPNAVFVVDEASMVHVPMLWMVLEKIISLNTPLVLVGDVSQLPPVMAGGEAYGFILDVLLRIDKVTSCELTEVFRQNPEAGGSILEVAGAILGPTLTTRDFGSRPGFTARKTDLPTITSHVIQALEKWGQEGKGMHHPVICQTNAVVQQANVALQQLLNPTGPEARLRIPGNGGPLWRFRVGDPVLCIKNITSRTKMHDDDAETVAEMLGEEPPTDKAIFLFANGSQGKVTDLNLRDKSIHIDFPNERCERKHWWPSKLVSMYIVPAYALTIHKAQGSEWDRGIVVVENTPFFQFRSSLYTGITRFKKECCLLGVKASMGACVAAPQNPTFRTLMVEHF